MEDDFQESLDAVSEFVPIPGMGQSLVATSEKVYFQNASSINLQELQEAMKFKKKQPETNDIQTQEESQNQFLEVGKWKKAKESTMNKDMETVKDQVDQIITQTRWRKKDPLEHPQKSIVDETWVPGKTQNEEEEENEIQDQTGQEHKEENCEGEDEAEEEEDEEEEEEEKGENGEDEVIERGKIKKEKGQKIHQSCEHEQRKVQDTPKSSKSKVSSQVSLDDKTDAQSEMKRTDYLPGKWSKKQSEDLWKRKESILLRIAKLLE